MKKAIFASVVGMVMLIASYATAAPSAAAKFSMAFPDARMIQDDTAQTPRLVYNFSAKSNVKANSQLAAQQFIAAYSDLFDIRNAAQELQHVRQFSMRKGRIVTFGQRYHGIPVLNGGIKVILNDAGDIVRVHNQYQPFADLPTAAVITRNEAIAQAWATVYGRPTADLTSVELNPNLTRLYVVPQGRDARLAYAIALPHPLKTERRIAFVDAHTGEFIMSLNGVVYAKMVNVWEYNPGADGTNEMVQRQLGEQEATDFAEMANSLHYAVNCPNDGETRSISIPGLGTFDIPMCTERPLSEADENGDYLYDPVFGAFEDPGVADDPFCEVHMFYHVDLMYNYIKEIATHIDAADPPFTNLNNVPFRAVCNFKTPDLGSFGGGGGSNGLVAFDNAFYTPAGGIFGIYPDEDSIVFGQGSTTDFAYDGEVIFHEFTHAVIGSVIALQAYDYDQYGMMTDPGAMNEGFADFFSSTYSGDPKAAEYVGNAFGELGVLRDLENDKLCPNDVKGEVHDDSEWFSAALWELRQTNLGEGGSHLDFDAAVFEALLTLSTTPSYTEAATAIALSIGEWFGEAAKTDAEGVFQARGLIDCNRAVPISDGDSIENLFLPDGQFRPVTPGFMQFHLQLAANTNYLQIEYFVPDQGSMFGSDPDVTVFGRSGEPVTFTYSRTVEAQADAEAAATEWDTSQPSAKRFVALLSPTEGDAFPTGDYYVALGVAPSGSGSIFGGMGGVLYHFQIKTETGEAPCNADSDCPACNLCTDEHECAPAEDECETDDDCRADKVCVQEECAKVCTRIPPDLDGDTEDGDVTDGDVTDGDVEDGDVIDGDDTCQNALDCDVCEICVGGSCLQKASQCETDDDCGEDMICEQGGCGGECRALGDVDGDVEPDGDDVVDGDESGSAGTGASSSSCAGVAGGPLSLLFAGLLLFRRRRR